MKESTINHTYEAMKVQVWEREHLEKEAELAFELLARWGMVAAETDGEDSVGRQRLRLQTPEELIDRAFNVAKLAIKRTRESGLMHETPSFPMSEEYIPPHARMWSPEKEKKPLDTSSPSPSANT